MRPENMGPTLSSLRDQRCITGKCRTEKAGLENVGPGIQTVIEDAPLRQVFDDVCRQSSSTAAEQVNAADDTRGRQPRYN